MSYALKGEYRDIRVLTLRPSVEKPFPIEKYNRYLVHFVADHTLAFPV